jgi:hypothetical protein
LTSSSRTDRSSGWVYVNADLLSILLF